MSFSTQIIPATTDLHYQHVRQLILEYAALRQFDAALDHLVNELDQLPAYYPLILLVYQQDQPAGCAAIQVLAPDICEMKRMFVSPPFRGRGIGNHLIEMLLREAKDLGFKYMRLDTHPSMTQAQAMYHRFGFTEIERYNRNPIPGIRFFELQLMPDV